MFVFPKVFDADTHINEPPSLWTDRLPSKLQDASPKIVEKDGLHMWTFPNGSVSLTPLMNCPGVPWHNLTPVTDKLYTHAGARAAAWDPAQRLVDMDIDRVFAHALFPSYVLTGPVLFGSDPTLHMACVKAYNDWMSEFASHDPERLVGVALVPLCGIDDAVAEVQRVAGLPGIRALLLTGWPNGSGQPDLAVDDRFYSAVEESGLALAVHVGFGTKGEDDGGDETGSLNLDEGYWTGTGGLRLARSNDSKLGVAILPVLSIFVLSGILERHPRMRFGVIEVGAGWVPFFLEQTEDALNRHRHWTKTTLKDLPRDYWLRQCFTTFQIDNYAIRNRDQIGIDNIMWSTDYPHAGADWPRSAINIENQMRNVPHEEVSKLVWDNAARFYGISNN